MSKPMHTAGGVATNKELHAAKKQFRQAGKCQHSIIRHFPDATGCAICGCTINTKG